MGKISITIGTLLVVIVLVLAGLGTYRWVYNRDYSTLYKDGEIIARSRWYVDMQRFYYNIKYDYQYDNCIRDGGTISESGTRCYLPDETFYRLTRKLLSIELNTQNFTNEYIVTRKTSFNKYGTSGVTAGSLYENITHNKIVNNIEEFPKDYQVSYIPRDSSNYKLVWKVDKLKDINLPDGKYTQCKYEFGAMKINLENECDKLDYVLVENDEDRIWIYFKKVKGTQDLKVDLTDPSTLLIDLRYYYSFDSDVTADYGGIYGDGAVFGATHFDAGGISKGYYYFDGINDYIAFNPWYTSTATSFSVSLWYKANNTEAGCTNVKNVGAGTDPTNPGVLLNHDKYGIWRIGICNNGSKFHVRFSDGEYGSRTLNMGSLYTWHHIVVSSHLTGGRNYLTICVDGTCNGPTYYFGKYYLFSGFYSTVYMGKTVTSYPSYAEGNQYNGSIDEVGIWDRILSTSERQELYNNGTGLTYGGFGDETGPVVTLVSPINYYNSSTSSVNFTYNTTDANDVISCDLWLNNGSWYVNDTDTSITKDTDQTFNKTLEEGIFNWKVGCEDEYGSLTNSSARTFTYDITAPVVQSQYPYDSGIIYDIDDIGFIFNVTDATSGIINCTIFLDDIANTTDTSITETINQTITINDLAQGSHTYKVGCYDDFENQANSTSRTFSIDIPPVIDLQAPANDTTQYDDPIVEFIFNASDIDNNITNCILLLKTNSIWDINETFIGWVNQSDGFDTSAFGSTDGFGITTNGSDFWITDYDADDWVYHTDAQGNNLTDGFSTSFAGESPLVEGITTNGSDFWVTDPQDDWVYHVNKSGYNFTDGFSTSFVGASLPSGITTNGSDFWIIDYDDDWVYHTDAQGNNLTGNQQGFSTRDIGSYVPLGITTNGSDFWIVDYNADWVYHVNKSGYNFTDGFSTLGFNSDASYDITTDSLINHNTVTDFWVLDILDYFVYHIEYGFEEVINHTVNITFGNIDIDIDWLVQCYTDENVPYNSSQNYLQLRDRPDVNLISPVNNTKDIVPKGNQILSYNVSDFGDVENCSLWTSTDLGSTWTEDDTDTSITKDIEQNLIKSITTDTTFYWLVGCWDNRSVQGNSSIWNVSFLINDAPVIDLQAPANFTITANRTTYFIFNVTDSDSGITNCSLWLNENYGGWYLNTTNSTGITEGANYTFKLNFSTNLIIDWKTQCYDDNVELASSNSTTRYLVIDNDLPEPILISPNNNTNQSTSYVNFTYNVSDTLSDVVNCSLWLFKSGSWENNMTNENIVEDIDLTFNVTFIPTGENVLWKVGCWDNATNQGNSSTYNITSDSTSPAITWVSPTENNNTYFNRTYINVSVSLVETFEYNITFRLYNSSNDVINLTSSRSPIRGLNYTGLGNDFYHYSVEVCDWSGNCDSETRYITLDSLYPIIIYGTETKDGGAIIVYNWTYVDVIITDISLKNVTYKIFNSTQDLLGSFNYENATYNYNFSSNMTDYGWYYYNVTTCDYMYWCSSTTTRSIKYVNETTVTIALSIGITDILFYPDNNTGIFQPEGQTDSLGIITVTNDYTAAVDIIIKINETREDIGLYAYNKSDYANSQLVNKTFFVLIDNLGTGISNYIWLWANYQNTNRTWLFPELEIKASI